MSEISSTPPENVAAALKPEQTNVSETHQAPPQPASNEIDKFASKFAALTRREREIAEKAKKAESEWSLKMKEIAEKADKYKPYEDLESQIGSNKRKALEFLQQKGISLEDLSSMLIEEMNPDQDVKLQRTLSETEKRLEAKLAAMEKALQEKDLKAKEEQETIAKQEHEKVVQTVLNELTEFVNSNEYPLIKQKQEVQMVYDVMNQHYMEQIEKGVPQQLVKILSYKDAADAVEAHLEEEIEMLYKARRSKPTAQPVGDKVEESSKTLTNALSATDASKVSEAPQSRDELLEQVTKMIKFT